jgi:hypothetical protein
LLNSARFWSSGVIMQQANLEVVRGCLYLSVLVMSARKEIDNNLQRAISCKWQGCVDEKTTPVVIPSSSHHSDPNSECRSRRMGTGASKYRVLV